MRWNASTRTLAMLVSCGSGLSIAALADDEPPPLTSPTGSASAIEAPDGSAPAAPTPIPAPASPRPTRPPPAPTRDDHPVLALPGITTPSIRSLTTERTTTATLPPPSLAPSPDGGLPPLEMPRAKPRATSPPSDLPPLPSERFRGRVIESIPTDTTLPPLDTPPIPGAVRSRGMTALPLLGPIGRDRSVLDETDILDPIDPKDLKDADGRDKSAKDTEKTTPPPPPRRFGLLNRFAPRSTTTGSESAIKAEPRSDPAADAAIKRRVEGQARRTVGDRARSIEVRVVERSITIQAHGVKFLQRRAVRKSLENLPGLSGYRSVVEVLD